jgi:NTE family protein
MNTPRDASLEAALAHIFAAEGETRASWFALTGGERLFTAGQPADTLYLVRSGRLGVFRQTEDNPEPQFLGVIRPGEPAGEMSLIAGTPHTATAVALRDSEILALPRDAFLDAARAHPDVMVELASLMVRRSRETSQRAADPSVFGFISAREKPIREFVERVRDQIGHLGFPARVIDSSALNSAAEWLSLIEQTHDFVLYCAEQDEAAWAGLCARQVDRLFVMGDMGGPARMPPVQRSGSLEEHQLTDLILLRPADGPAPRDTVRWLKAVDPARWFHVREGLVDDEARVARVLTATCVGLVLSGGGARAYAHLGAIAALREAGVPFDFVGGSSMGAVIGAGVALGWTQQELEDRIRKAFVEHSPLSDIAFPIVAMTHGRKVNQLLIDAYGDVDIADLPLPFFCGSSNLTANSYVVHRRGMLRKALRASISLPGVLPPAVIDGQVLVDGAVLRNLPADVMRGWQPGPVVAVDVSRTHTVDPSVVENPKTWWRWIISGDWRQGPPIVSILMRSATITSAADLAESRAATDLLVMPELGGVEIRDWKAFEPAVKAGWAAATAALAGLKGPVTHLRLRRARKAALSERRSGTASETASASSRPPAAGKRAKAAPKAPKEKRPAGRRKAPSDTA